MTFRSILQHFDYKIANLTRSSVLNIVYRHYQIPIYNQHRNRLFDKNILKLNLHIRIESLLHSV